MERMPRLGARLKVSGRSAPARGRRSQFTMAPRRFRCARGLGSVGRRRLPPLRIECLKPAEALRLRLSGPGHFKLLACKWPTPVCAPPPPRRAAPRRTVQAVVLRGLLDEALYFAAPPPPVFQACVPSGP